MTCCLARQPSVQLHASLAQPPKLLVWGDCEGCGVGLAGGVWRAAEAALAPNDSLKWKYRSMSVSDRPQPTSEAELEDLLAQPGRLAQHAMRHMQGDLLLLGAGGKMGPSLARLARRAANAVGRSDLQIIAVSRFSDGAIADELQAEGIETIAGDLLDESFRRRLPQVENVLFLFGHKFSKHDLPGQYWAMNVYLPGLMAEQYAQSRIVCFSSGNVYPFTRAGQVPPCEADPTGPVGEYAASVLGREGVLRFVSSRHGTRVCLLRLNYAVEARYGVLVDLAKTILAGETISLAVPEFNFVWQGYANAVALAAFAKAASPATLLNVTGVERHRVRDVALELGKRLGVQPKFADNEGERALVADARRCRAWFGPPELGPDELYDLVAHWVREGRPTLGKPTMFHVSDGKY